MEFCSNTELTGKDIIEVFIKSGLHSVGSIYVTWKSIAVCVSLVTMHSGLKTLLIWTNKGKPSKRHAEDGIVNFVDEYTQKISSVKIFCNYSPCSNPGFDCCSRLLKTKEKLMKNDCQETNFEFVFSTLYNVNRPSCLKRGCFDADTNGGHSPIEESESDSNLRSLGRLGSSIRSFETGDWAELIELLALWDASRGVAAAGLASIRYGEKYGLWRNFEDAEVKSDFEMLKQRLDLEARKKEISLRHVRSFDIKVLVKEVCKLKEALAKLR